MLTELQTLSGHSDRVWHVSWSPSGVGVQRWVQVVARTG